MKHFVTFVVACLCCVHASTKTLKVLVVKTLPEMHCEKCEKKIKSNIRLVKGTKLIVTDLTSKTVSITYDADKSAAEDFMVAFEKIGYKVTVVSDKVAPKKTHAIDGTTSASSK